MAGKTKKQILQELEESQKRIQELLREVDRLKRYSSIYESNQKQSIISGCRRKAQNM